MRPVAGCAALAVAGGLHALVNLALLRRPPSDPPRVARPVTVVVPARNEERHIGRCLATVLAQRGVAVHVRVVDDASTDGTAAAVEAVGDPRVELVAAPPLPAGWLGKPHACAVGADGVDDGVLVFVDADVRLAPHAIAAAVALLDAHDLDLVSPWPRPIARGVERLVQPVPRWLWMTTLPVRGAERSPRPSLTAANGQFLVVRAEAYRRAGGHAAVHGEVLEDIALARAIKRAGGRAVPVAGAGLASCRMYEGWRELSAGYEKSLWGAVGGSPFATAAAAAVLTAAAVVPAVAALGGSRVGSIGYLAGVVGRIAAGSGADALAHPLSMLALDVLLARSILGRRRGTLTWRGRGVGADARPQRRRTLEPASPSSSSLT